MSRRIDLSKFRGDSDDEGDLGPPPKVIPVQLDSLKQQTFSQGVHKKTKRDIERENEERKRKQEEIDNAKAIAEYEAEFSGYDRASARGMPPRGPRGGGFVKSAADGGSGAYMPARHFPTGPAAMRTPMTSYAGPSRSTAEEAKSKPKGARAMDSFLDEIKKEQQFREQKYGHVAKQEGTSISALAAWERQRGSHDVGDLETTNIFVSNMPAGVSEDSLGMFFAKHGPVGTVKIMWPRGESDFAAATAHGGRPKAGLSGFVAFMKRRDAESAVKELDGFDWGGSILRVGWGKMVRLPARPLYEIKRERSRSQSPRRRASPLPARRRSRSDERTKRRHDSFSSQSSDSRDRTPPPKSRHAALMDKLLARIDPENERFVRACAEKVAHHGRAFEDMLRTREVDNPKFAFLRDDQSPEYQLYRSIVDRNYRLPSPPPDDFCDEGTAALDSEDSAEDSENERCKKGTIGKLARRRFENGLRCVRGNRLEIARLMEFAVIHADAYEQVADVLCKSLSIASTPIPRKIARLHLVSDILHNSAAPLPNVWQYPRAFESRLQGVMQHFCEVHRALVAQNGRLSAEAFKDQVLFVLMVWESWLVFTPATLDTLRRALHGETPSTLKEETTHSVTPSAPTHAESKFKKSSGFKSIATVAQAQTAQAPPAASAAHDPDNEGRDGRTADDLDEEVIGDRNGVATDDLDGEAMDDLDGEAMDDLDGEAMDDVDGEAMDDLDGKPVDDVDGQPMGDEDLDGEAMS